MRVHDRHVYRSGALFEHGIDLGSRTVFLWGDIDEDSISKAGKAILMLDAMGDKAQDNIITLVISTYGGNEYEMLGLYDIMTNCDSTIKTVGIGKVMSAGPLLLSAGDDGHRYLYEHARTMLHWGDVEFEGKKEDVRSDMKESDELDKIWYDLMARHTKKDAKWWKKITEQHHTDYFIKADKALEWGIIDHIIKPDDEDDE